MVCEGRKSSTHISSGRLSVCYRTDEKEIRIRKKMEDGPVHDTKREFGT